MRRYALSAAVAIIALVIVPLLRVPVTANDFAIYWAAGRKALAGGSPYAPERGLLQRQVRFVGTDPLILRNPPWALPVILPFALLDYGSAQKLWLLAGLAAVIVSVHWLVQLYGAPRRHRAGWLAVAMFLPVAVVLAIGQIGPFLLLGVAGFLHFEAKRKPIFAGAFLFLLSLKPHLALLFWAGFGFYVIVHQEYESALGFLAVLGAMSAVSLSVHPAVFREYFDLWRGSSGFVSEVNPTLGGLLTLASHAKWTQFIPAILSGIWFAVYWRRHARVWSWKNHTPMLLIVSMLATWYGWFFDQVLLVPSVLQALSVSLSFSKRSKVAYGAAYLAINAAVLVLILSRRTTFWYVWTMPAWFLLYLGVMMSQEPPGAVVGER